MTITETTELLVFAFRFLTGIGVGGAMPSAVALTGEYFPERVRSTSITLIYIGFSLGQIAAGVVSGLLLEPFGWRAVLGFGGATTIALSAMFVFLLPESLEFLLNRGNGRDRAAEIVAMIAPQLRISGNTRLISGRADAKQI